MNSILFALWFFLPAGVANMAPIIASRLPYLKNWNFPLDFGARYRGKRVFGAHKTWRGLLSGIVAAIIVIYFQQLLWQATETDFLAGSSTGYMYYSPLLLGALFGLGALLGDAIESFFKRQNNIPSGNSWFPFDQIDYIIGGCITLALVARLNLLEYMLVLTIWFVLHIIFSYTGYLLKLKPRPL